MSAAFHDTSAACLISLAASEDRAREHMMDFLRTRILPGADPRAEWDVNDETDATSFRSDPDDPKFYESGMRGEPPRICWLSDPWQSLRPRPYRSEKLRYLPCDVRRWRDPEHRASLAARARAHAAIKLRARR